MKKEIAKFVARCLVCQQVKIEHQKPSGLMQRIKLPEWRWEHITMDFVVGLPVNQKGNDAIGVIVDRLTKSAHFIALKTGHSIGTMAQKYLQEVVRLHGIPVSINSDRDPRFTSHFCRSLQEAMGSQLSWAEVGEKHITGPELGAESNRNIVLIRKRLLAAQSRQKSYADQRRRELGHDVGDHVFLKVSPTKGKTRFVLKGKLSPRYIGPFQIIECVGSTTYRLALPPQLSGVHDVFHVSMLRKYTRDPNHILQHETLEFEQDLSVEEEPVKVMEKQEQRLEAGPLQWSKLNGNITGQRKQHGNGKTRWRQIIQTCSNKRNGKISRAKFFCLGEKSVTPLNFGRGSFAKYYM